MEIMLGPVLIKIALLLLLLYFLYRIWKHFSGNNNLKKKYSVKILSTSAIKGKKDQFTMKYQLLDDKGKVVTDKRLEWKQASDIPGSKQEPLGSFNIVDNNGKESYDVTINLPLKNALKSYATESNDSNLAVARVEEPRKLVKVDAKEKTRENATDPYICIVTLTPLADNIDLSNFKVGPFSSTAALPKVVPNGFLGYIDIDFGASNATPNGTYEVVIDSYSGATNIRFYHEYSAEVPPPPEEDEMIEDPGP